MIVAPPSPPAPSHVPPDLVLPSLDGELRISNLKGVPVILNAFDKASGFSLCLWQNRLSMDELIRRAAKDGGPPKSHFVFASHAETPSEALADVSTLRESINGRLEYLNVSSAARSVWSSHLHYLPTPVRNLSFVRDVLDAWPTVRQVASLRLTSGQPALAIPRLDARYDWLGWNFDPSRVFGNASVAMAVVGEGCSPYPVDVTGKLALATNSTQCDYYHQAARAQEANATGLVVIAAEGMPLVDMNCVGAECDDTSVGLPATMISNSDGAAIIAALGQGGGARDAPWHRPSPPTLCA